VTLVRTDVSEEQIALIIRVERISELGTTLALTSNWTQCHMPEDAILQSFDSLFWPVVINMSPFIYCRVLKCGSRETKHEYTCLVLLTRYRL
jgi:hypothetical protein